MNSKWKKSHIEGHQMILKQKRDLQDTNMRRNQTEMQRAGQGHRRETAAIHGPAPHCPEDTD